MGVLTKVRRSQFFISLAMPAAKCSVSASSQADNDGKQQYLRRTNASPKVAGSGPHDEAEPPTYGYLTAASLQFALDNPNSGQDSHAWVAQNYHAGATVTRKRLGDDIALQHLLPRPLASSGHVNGSYSLLLSCCVVMGALRAFLARKRHRLATAVPWQLPCTHCPHSSRACSPWARNLAEVDRSAGRYCLLLAHQVAQKNTTATASFAGGSGTLPDTATTPGASSRRASLLFDVAGSMSVAFATSATGSSVRAAPSPKNRAFRMYTYTCLARHTAVLN